MKKLFATLAVICGLASPALLMIIGIWMIYNVGLWIGLGITGVGYAGCTFSFAILTKALN